MRRSVTCLMIRSLAAPGGIVLRRPNRADRRAGRHSAKRMRTRSSTFDRRLIANGTGHMR